MSNKKWYSGQSQVRWVCKALIDGRTISHKAEIREARGWRLSAIVHRLRTEFFWPITTEYRGPENIAYYSLPKNTETGSLRLPRSARDLNSEEAT